MGVLLDEAKKDGNIHYAVTPAQRAEAVLLGTLLQEVVINGRAYLEFRVEDRIYLVEQGLHRDR